MLHDILKEGFLLAHWQIKQHWYCRLYQQSIFDYQSRWILTIFSFNENNQSNLSKTFQSCDCEFAQSWKNKPFYLLEQPNEWNQHLIPEMVQLSYLQLQLNYNTASNANYSCDYSLFIEEPPCTVLYCWPATLRLLYGIWVISRYAQITQLRWFGENAWNIKWKNVRPGGRRKKLGSRL